MEVEDGNGRVWLCDLCGAVGDVLRDEMRFGSDFSVHTITSAMWCCHSRVTPPKYGSLQIS